MTSLNSIEPTQGDADFGATLASRMRALIARGQIGAAELLLPTLEKLVDMQESAIAIKAEIALAGGFSKQATEMLDRGLERFPANFAMLILRAEIGLSERDFATATTAAAEAVIARPDNAGAKSLLGRALLELGRVEQATICLREACAAIPAHAPTRLALARAVPEEADSILRTGIALAPTEIAFRNALIRALLAQDQLESAQIEIKSTVDSGTCDIETRLLAIEAATHSADWAEAARLCDDPQFVEIAHA
ncbi:tetratricopeptide repeat protein [Acidiphilium iwatense]|uniref:Tetratricopeptide repeat protein n=1 Tax=Acidiphilium iwatense TaxID=768198 RepID=A0ABS9DUV4_9PROT|nr:hypothetical protein [Acidiphilium iwatense]MCF3946523.1 hypothetical protein [Acidiphilium iwatense]